MVHLPGDGQARIGRFVLCKAMQQLDARYPSFLQWTQNLCGSIGFLDGLERLDRSVLSPLAQRRRYLHLQIVSLRLTIAEFD